MARAKHPRLRDAMPVWIEQQAASGDIRASTAGIYKGRLRHWVYPHPLKGGGVLGNLPINPVTREHLGSLILRIKAAGRSASIIDGVRNPLRSFFQAQVEMRASPHGQSRR